MGKILDRMKGLILLVVSILAFLVYSHFKDQENNERDYDFQKYGMFTLGRVVEYSSRTNGGSSQDLKFAYLVQNKYYLEESDYYVPVENGPKEGSLFMAVYLPKYPKISGLLLDYPVKCAGDFNKYMEEFKTHRPKFGK